MTHYEQMHTSIIILVDLRNTLCFSLTLMLVGKQFYFINRFYIDFFENDRLQIIYQVLHFLRFRNGIWAAI